MTLWAFIFHKKNLIGLKFPMKNIWSVCTSASGIPDEGRWYFPLQKFVVPLDVPPIVHDVNKFFIFANNTELNTSLNLKTSLK